MGFRDDCISAYKLEEQIQKKRGDKQEKDRIELSKQAIIDDVKSVIFKSPIGIIKSFDISKKDIKLVERNNDKHLIFRLDDLKMKRTIGVGRNKYSIAHTCKKCNKEIFISQFILQNLTMKQIGQIITNFGNVYTNDCFNCKDKSYKEQRKKANLDIAEGHEKKDLSLTKRFANIMMELLREYGGC